MILYLSFEQVLFIHKKLIEAYGGSDGIRDEKLLDSAVFRPQTSAFGEDAYPDLFTKAAVLMHSIVKNHPFVDGNKRTGFGAMHLMLSANGYELKASIEEVIELGINVAKGELNEKTITAWIKTHSKKL